MKPLLAVLVAAMFSGCSYKTTSQSPVDSSMAILYWGDGYSMSGSVTTEKIK